MKMVYLKPTRQPSVSPTQPVSPTCVVTMTASSAGPQDEVAGLHSGTMFYENYLWIPESHFTWLDIHT